MHLIWDWNGTLFDDLHVVVDAVNASLRAIDAPIQIDADGYRDHYHRPVRGFYDAMLGRAVSDEEWATVNTRFHEVYAADLARATLTSDAHGAAAEAARRGITQSILSMWTHDELVPTVLASGLGEMMVAVRGAASAQGERKADLLQRHLAELELTAVTGKVVMIGDTFDDAHAAAALGVAVVLYNGGSHHRSDLEATGLPIADTLFAAVDLAFDLGQ